MTELMFSFYTVSKPYIDREEFDIPTNEACKSQTVSIATRRNRQLPLMNRTRGDVGVQA